MLNIEPIKLLRGSHADTGATGQGCFMNVIAYLNGESQITDQSPCVCVTIRPIAIFLNDFATDKQRQRLRPFLLRAMGTTTDDQDVMNMRIAAVVGYAEFNARIAAKSAEFAKSAKYAEYAAKYAAEYAELAEYAKSTEFAVYAAKSAARSAKSAKSAARCEAIFQAGLDFLEKACPPASEINQEIIRRAECLVEMAAEIAQEAAA